MGSPRADVDAALDQQQRWQAELKELRRIILGCGLDEQLKWGWPCYSTGGKNVVLIHAFKDYCAVLFFKGALIDDPNGVLIQQTGNVQAGRQMRFVGLKDIEAAEALLKHYVARAVEVEKSGATVTYKQTSEFPVPEELQAALDANPTLKAAFFALTPGRQRAYILHFSAPKQAKTRVSRVEKCAPQILQGKGLND